MSDAITNALPTDVTHALQEALRPVHHRGDRQRLLALQQPAGDLQEDHQQKLREQFILQREVLGAGRDRVRDGVPADGGLADHVQLPALLGARQVHGPRPHRALRGARAEV